MLHADFSVTAHSPSMLFGTSIPQLRIKTGIQTYASAAMVRR